MKIFLKIIMFFLLSLCFTSGTFAQKFFSKTGKISFYSSTPIENIEAESNSASTVFDVPSAKIQWSVLIKSFEFEKALMQEHFNENYMESSKYPKAKFDGQIVNMDEIALDQEGNYETIVKGTLEIHGVSKEIEVPVTFKVDRNGVKGQTVFKVLVAEYGIEIPAVVRENIAKEIEITVNADYELLDRS
jgi:polyisoprenoid-binding protein YceI